MPGDRASDADTAEGLPMIPSEGTGSVVLKTYKLMSTKQWGKGIYEWAITST